MGEVHTHTHAHTHMHTEQTIVEWEVAHTVQEKERRLPSNSCSVSALRCWRWWLCVLTMHSNDVVTTATCWCLQCFSFCWHSHMKRCLCSWGGECVCVCNTGRLSGMRRQGKAGITHSNQLSLGELASHQLRAVSMHAHIVVRVPVPCVAPHAGNGVCGLHGGSFEMHTFKEGRMLGFADWCRAPLAVSGSCHPSPCSTPTPPKMPPRLGIPASSRTTSSLWDPKTA